MEVVIVGRPVDLTTYDVLGQQLTAQEILYLFGVRRADFLNRMRVDGVPPVVAVLMPRAKYNKLSLKEKMFLGWEYWCKKEDVSLIEDDSLFRINEYFGATKGYWFEDGSSSTYTSSGIIDTTLSLYKYRRNPEMLASAWIQAIRRHDEIKDSYEPRRDMPLQRTIEYAWNARSTLPDDILRLSDEDRRYVLDVDAFSAESAGIANDTFKIIGYCVRRRKIILQMYKIHLVGSLKLVR
jgi:hypothetical protein